MRKPLFVGLSALGLVISGCASNAAKPFAPVAAIESVALVEIPAISEYSLDNRSATMIGLMASKAGHQAALRDRIASSGFDLSGTFGHAIRTELKAVGLRVDTVQAPRGNPFRLLDSYDGITTGAQTILDITPGPGVGYSTGTPLDKGEHKTDYRPSFAFLKVRLVDAKTHEVLYSESIKYGDNNPFVGGTEIPAPEGTYYATIGELLSSDNAAKGFSLAVKDIARYIAVNLKRGNTLAAKGQPSRDR